MKIMRKGAAADHGVKFVELENPTVTFDADDAEFLLKIDSPVRDFSLTGSRHIYRVEVKLPEFVAMAKALSKKFKDIDFDDDATSAELRKLALPFFRMATLLATKS